MISQELFIVLSVLLIGEGVIAITLFIVHIQKLKEIRELKKKIDTCTESFGGYLSLLDKRNLKLIRENGVLDEEIRKLEEKEKATRTTSPRK